MKARTQQVMAVVAAGMVLLCAGGCKKESPPQDAGKGQPQQGKARPGIRPAGSRPAASPTATSAAPTELPGASATSAPAGAPIPLTEFLARNKQVSLDDSFATFAGLNARPCYRVPLVAEAPNVDGQMDAAYRKAQPIAFRFLSGRSGKPQAETAVRCVSTDKDLYVFFACQCADTAALKAQVTQHDADVWRDDSVEIFLDPTDTRGPNGYHHIIVNSVGTTYESRGGKGKEDVSWNPKLLVKTKLDKTLWTVELAIPLGDLVTDAANFDRVWAGNFNRMAFVGEGTEDTAWCPTGSENSHDPTMFGSLWLEAGKVYAADLARWRGPQHVYSPAERATFQVAPADAQTVALAKEVAPNADGTWAFGPIRQKSNNECLVVIGPERSVVISSPHGWRPIVASWLNNKLLMIRRDTDEHEGYYGIYDVQRNAMLILEQEGDGVSQWERLSKPKPTTVKRSVLDF